MILTIDDVITAGKENTPIAPRTGNSVPTTALANNQVVPAPCSFKTISSSNTLVPSGHDAIL